MFDTLVIINKHVPTRKREAAGLGRRAYPFLLFGTVVNSTTLPGFGDVYCVRATDGCYDWYLAEEIEVVHGNT